jgi:hypothetical protein
MNQNNLKEFGLFLYDKGFNIIAEDSEKKPITKWSPLQRISREELEAALNNPKCNGIAIVGGYVHPFGEDLVLLIIDIDNTKDFSKKYPTITKLLNETIAWFSGVRCPYCGGKHNEKTLGGWKCLDCGQFFSRKEVENLKEGIRGVDGLFLVKKENAPNSTIRSKDVEILIHNLQRAPPSQHPSGVEYEFIPNQQFDFNKPYFGIRILSKEEIDQIIEEVKIAKEEVFEKEKGEVEEEEKGEKENKTKNEKGEEEEEEKEAKVLSTEEIDRVVEILKLVYKKGRRQYLWLYFSGWAAKEGLSPISCAKILMRLYKEQNDEDPILQRVSAFVGAFEGSLRTLLPYKSKLEEIFGIRGLDLEKIPEEAKNVKGISGVKEIFEEAMGKEMAEKYMEELSSIIVETSMYRIPIERFKEMEKKREIFVSKTSIKNYKKIKREIEYPREFWWFNKESGALEKCQSTLLWGSYIKVYGTEKTNIYKNRIKVVKDKNEIRYVAEDKKSFTLKEYLNKKGIVGSDKLAVITMLENLFENSKENANFGVIEFYDDNGYLKFPKIEDIVVKEGSFVDEFKKGLVIKEVDLTKAKEELKRAFQLLTPKQRSDLIFYLGNSTANILIETYNLQHGKAFGSSSGETGTGKTFAYLFSQKFFWGIERFWGGDALRSSAFRLNEMVESTPLPILIDEAENIRGEIWETIKAGTSGAETFRGRSDLTIKPYDFRAVLFFTSNDPLFENLSIDQRRAAERRFYLQRYNKEDVVKDTSQGEKFMREFETRGAMYKILESVPAKELIEELEKIYNRASGSNISVIAAYNFGAYLLKRFFDIDVKEWGIKYESGKSNMEEVYERILSDCRRYQLGKDQNDSIAKDLESKMKIEENVEEGVSWVYITNEYIRKYLKGLVSNLGDLVELEPLFPPEVIKKLPWGRIYSKSNVKKIWDNHPQVRFAVIPIIEDYTLPKIEENLLFEEWRKPVEKKEGKEEEAVKEKNKPKMEFKDIPNFKTIAQVLLKWNSFQKDNKDFYVEVMNEHLKDYELLVHQEEINKAIDKLFELGKTRINPKTGDFEWVDRNI